MNNLQKFVQHFRNSWHCGTHSNIPWHCRLWFATVDWYLRWPQWYRALIAPRMARHGMRYRYVPCPWCLLVRRKPNRVARCPDTCYRHQWIRTQRAQHAASVFTSAGIRPGDQICFHNPTGLPVFAKVRGVRATRLVIAEAQDFEEKP